MDTFVTELITAIQNAVPLLIAYSIVPTWMATVIIPLLIVLLRHGLRNVNFWNHKTQYETVTIHEFARHNNNEYYAAVSYYLINDAKIRSDDSIEILTSSATIDVKTVEKISRQEIVYDGCKIVVYSESAEIQYQAKDRMIHLQSRNKTDIFRFTTFTLKNYRSFKNNGSTGEHHYNDGLSWNTSPMYVTKTFENIYLDPSLRQHLLSEVDAFVESEQFYKRRGIAYRRGFLMYGSPGCGKTSVINAIADRTGFQIRSLHLGRIKDGGMLRKVAHGIPPGSIVVLEDLDCLTSTRKRHKVTLTKEAFLYMLEHVIKMGDDGRSYCECPGLSDALYGTGPSNIEEKIRSAEEVMENDPTNAQAFMDRIGLRNEVPGGYKELNTESDGAIVLSDLLDILDSNTFLYKTIVIITSNRPNKFDPALIRSGRIDAKFEFHPAGETLIHQIFRSFYPEITDDHLPKISKPIPQSTLINSIIIPNRKNYKLALDALNKLMG